LGAGLICMAPILLLYLRCSRRLRRGGTAGAIT